VAGDSTIERVHLVSGNLMVAEVPDVSIGTGLSPRVGKVSGAAQAALEQKGQ